MRRQRIPAAPVAGLVVGILVFAVALGFGRADLAVIGLVLPVAVAVALLERPAEQGVDLRVEEVAGETGGDTTMRVRVDAPGAELVRITSRALGFLSLPLATTPSAELVIHLPLRHTGRQELLAIRASAVGADGGWVGEATPTTILGTRLMPRAVRLPYLPVPAVLGGRTGSHELRRPGDGGEFHDLHPFGPGDRLRRIDWRATARLARTPGDLLVRRSQATADADIALVVDDRDDLSGSPSTWSLGDRGDAAPTSLDLAREAAWSLASAYLDAADQVSFQVVSHAAGEVPRGAGARQRRAIRAAITEVHGGSPLARVGVPRVPRGALVVLLSTFLDDRAVDLAVRWRRSGHRVLAIDTLPRPGRERIRREALLAERVVQGMRDDRLRTLRTVGVDLLRWDAPAGERSATLRAMTRTRRRG